MSSLKIYDYAKSNRLIEIHRYGFPIKIQLRFTCRYLSKKLSRQFFFIYEFFSKAKVVWQSATICDINLINSLFSKWIHTQIFFSSLLKSILNDFVLPFVKQRILDLLICSVFILNNFSIIWKSMLMFRKVAHNNKHQIFEWLLVLP